jgi:MoaA/NifB/PqqE/SkfB family radical SAM enzyme
MNLGKGHWNEATRDYRLRRTSEIVRGPIEWAVDLTNRCVGRCLHCFNRSWSVRRDELSDSEVLSMAEEIASLKPLGMCFCGGEPLLRLDVLCRSAEILARVGTTVNTVTTGYVLDSAAARRLKDSGLHNVQVSLDGADSTSHERLRRLGGGFRAATRALEDLAAVGLQAGIAFAPTRFNADEFPRVIDLAKQLGACEVRVQPLMPLGEGLLHWHEIAPSPQQLRSIVEVCQEHVLRCSTAPTVTWGDPVDHLIRFAQFYDSACHDVQITSDGYLTPSPYLPLFLGNIRRHRLSEYWRAGLARAWDHELVRGMAYHVRSVEDLGHLHPIPFIEQPILLDLVDDSTERQRAVTDAALAMVERVLRIKRNNETTSFLRALKADASAHEAQV